MTWIIWLMLVSVCSAAVEQTPVDRMLDRVVNQERDLMTLLAKHNPIVETYIQVQPSASASGATAVAIEKDVYFLGRMNLTNEISYEALLESDAARKPGKSFFGRAGKPKEFAFLPKGFAQMSIIDSQAFNRAISVSDNLNISKKKENF